MQAGEKTREDAAKRIEKKILDVGCGRIRLGLSVDELEKYIQSEYRRMREIREGMNERH